MQATERPLCAGRVVCDLRMCHSYYRQRPFRSSPSYHYRWIQKVRTQTDADQSNMIHLHRSSFSFAGQGRSAYKEAFLRPCRGVREIALDDTLCFDITCSNHLMVSPPLRGSNPYPCGSLTYRIVQYNCRSCSGVCQPYSEN